MQKLLDELIEKLTKQLGDRVVSVILYGSAAEGDYQGDFSDLNILCVTRQVTTKELTDAEPVVRWWREKENPSPLLMSVDEVANSTDAFPIEFHDIKEHGRVLFGEDIRPSIDVHDHFYRAEVEHELRAKLLRLRQKSAGMMHDRTLLLRLLADSVSTFCVLIRHALALHGEPRKTQKRDVLAQAESRFGIDASPLRTLLDLRDKKVKGRDLEPVSMLEDYMKQVRAVIAAVDALGKPKED
jgi:predicted nucleotidyltransferase